MKKQKELDITHSFTISARIVNIFILKILKNEEGEKEEKLFVYIFHTYFNKYLTMCFYLFKNYIIFNFIYLYLHLLYYVKIFIKENNILN